MLFNPKQVYRNTFSIQAILAGLLIGAFGLYFYTENYLIPLVFIALLAFASLLVDYRYSLYVLIFSLPLSLSLRLDQLNLTINLPSEPLIGLLTLTALVFIFLQNQKLEIARHPLSKIVLFYWATLAISCVFSTMPMVSLKTLVVSTSYLVVFYFFLAYYFSKHNGGIKAVFFTYALSMVCVVLYATWRHADVAFNKMYSATSVTPFFSDHTIYGACLSFLVPIAGMLYFRSTKLGLNAFQKMLAGLFLVVFLVGIYLSHSRATWMSLLIIPLVLLILKLKISFTYLLSIVLLLLLVASFNMEVLMPMLVKNKNDSKGKRANLEEQIRSVTNIKNDVSNAERINRWQCAFRMFKEKPFTGYGVGTYQFKYIPFQKESEMTPISITSAKNNYAQGMGGTAHSEYLLALSESGLFSALGLVAIVLYSLHLGMKLYYKGNEEVKYYALMVLLSLLTYFLHGIFNNFLTTDKATFLVWGGLATLCVLDINYKKNEKN